MFGLLYTIFRSLSIFLSIIEWAIVIYCVLSWFQPRFRAFYLLAQFIQPFLAPFRTLSMKVSRYFNVPIDFTCLFAILGLQIAQRLLGTLFRLLAFRVF